MDITVYDEILQLLKEYNNSLEQNYGNVIVGSPPTKPSYPLTIFNEIQNNPYHRTNIRSLDKIDSLGYELNIYAKAKGEIKSQAIARELAKELNDYLTDVVGLNQLSMNPLPNLNDGSIYRINLRYTAKYNLNRAKIL